MATQLNNIGSGVLFPIKIAPRLDEDGNPIKVPELDENGEPTGNMVNATGWYPTVSDPELVTNNLTAILVYQVGQRIRQEGFGTKIRASIEEFNTQVLAYLLEKNIREAIEKYEPRVNGYKVILEREGDKLKISLYYRLVGSSTIALMNGFYNIENGSIYVTD